MSADRERMKNQFAARGKKLDRGKSLKFKKLEDLPLDVVCEAIAQVPPGESYSPVRGKHQEEVMRSAICLLLLLLGLSASAQPNANPAREALEKRVDGMEKQLLAAAEAMPPDRYTFVPTAGTFRGVRSFSKQLKHAAAVHYIVGAAILNEPPPADAADERGPDAARTKAEVIQYVKDSCAYLRKAVATINAQNLLEPLKTPFGSGMETRLGLVMSAMIHSSNHYGQIVEYLRMNNIVPPASE